jgi:flagellar biosynthesis GTPase FlhF
MRFQKTAFLLMMLFILSFFVPHVCAQIPKAPPPTRDQRGTEESWDISHPGWREKRAEAARKKEETRQLRLKRAQAAATQKAEAKKRKQQADAKARRQKEAKRIEQKRKAAIEAEKRQKDRERKAHALDMMKRFQKANGDAALAASENTGMDEIVYRQNDLFVGILSNDAISPKEKTKCRLNLPVYNNQTPYRVLMSKVPPMQGGFGDNYLNNGDGSLNLDVGSDMPGLENVSRLSAEITDLLQSEAISEVKDFIIGSIQNPRMAMALKAAKAVSEFNADVLANTLKDIQNAVDLLTAQPGLSQDFVMLRKD